MTRQSASKKTLQFNHQLSRLGSSGKTQDKMRLLKCMYQNFKHVLINATNTSLNLKYILIGKHTHTLSLTLSLSLSCVYLSFYLPSISLSSPFYGNKTMLRTVVDARMSTRNLKKRNSCKYYISTHKNKMCMYMYNNSYIRDELKVANLLQQWLICTVAFSLALS